MKLTIRDALWATLVVALAVALGLQTVRYQKAAHEAKNRELENEYWVKKVLVLDKEFRGTLDNPKPWPKPSTP